VKRKTKAYLLALSAVLCWSTVGSAFKLTLRYVKPPELLLYTLPVALAVTAVLLTATGSWRSLKETRRCDLLRSAVLGFLNPFLYYNVLFRGYDLLLTQEATTLNFLWPIVLVVLSAPILKQSLTLKTLGALGVGFAGVYVVATQGDVGGFRLRSPEGIFLTLSSTVIWALFWIYNVKDSRPPLVKLFLNFAFGLLFMFTYWLFFMEHSPPPREGLLGAAYAGVFEMGLTFFLWLKALSLAEKTAHIANLIFITPFGALVCIHFAVGEPIYPSTLIGLALIVTGIVIQKREERAARPKHAIEPSSRER